MLLVDPNRRAALRGIASLAGAAPAVLLLLTPSKSRAIGCFGTPIDDADENCDDGDVGFDESDFGGAGSNAREL